MGQNALLHGKSLSVIPTTDLDHMTLLLFTESISSYSCGHAKLVIHFSEFPTAGGREGDSQIHPNTDDGLGGANKKMVVVFFGTNLRKLSAHLWSSPAYQANLTFDSFFFLPLITKHLTKAA